MTQQFCLWNTKRLFYFEESPFVLLPQHFAAIAVQNTALLFPQSKIRGGSLLICMHLTEHQLLELMQV